MIKEQELRFIRAYSAQTGPFNGTKAALAAGYSPGNSANVASELLRRIEIQEAISNRMLELAAPLDIAARDILQIWVDRATGDPTEITQVRRLNCRHCWGLNHAYQWSPREYAEAVAKAMHKEQPIPTDEGGCDWVFNADPNPDCPDCLGEGVADLYLADMRKLSRAQKRLIAGVQQTKDGVKVLFHSQPDAELNLAKYLGIVIDRKELTGPNGGPIQTQNANINANLSDLSPQDASKAYQAMLGAGK